MKKCLLITLLLILLCSFVSCKNDKTNKKEFDNINYHFSGLYIELQEDTEYKVKGINPSVFYLHNKNEFSNWKGTNFDIGSITAENITKNVYVENNVEITKLHISFIFPSNAPEKAKVYVITEDLYGTLMVNKNEYDVIDISKQGSYTLNRQYLIDNQKYWFQLTLGYFVKEV